MSRIFSQFVICMFFLTLTTNPVSAQKKERGQGKGQDRSRMVCIDKSEPTLTTTLDGKELWILTPEEVMELPGSYEIDRGPNDKLKAIKLISLLPKNWDNGRVSFISCTGQRINVPAPHLMKKTGRYIVNINRKGFLKLILKSEDIERVIMRDMRRIEFR